MTTAMSFASRISRSVISSMTPIHTPSVGLVEQQQARLGEKRATDRQHFAFAAGQRAGGLIEPLAELGKYLDDAIDRAAVAIGQRADRKIVAHRQSREHRMLLRHVTEARANPLFGRQMPDVARIELDRAALNRQLADQRLQQGCFAGTIAAENGDAAAPRNSQ